MPEGSQEKKKVNIGASLSDALGLYGYMGKYRSVFIPSLIALFLTAGLSLAFPYFLGELIGGPATAQASSEIDKVKLGESINKTVITLLSILLLQAFISYWRVRGFIKAGEGALNDIRAAVFAKLVRLPMHYFLEHRSGEISGRVANDLSVLRDTLLTTVPQFARMVMLLLGGLVIIFITSVKLSLIMLLSIPVVVLLVAIFGRKIRTYSKNAQDALSDSNIVIEESVQSIADVKSFGNEGFEQSRYQRSLDRFIEVTMKGAKARASFVSFIIFVLFGTISVVVWFGAQMLINDQISTEEFTRFILFSIFVGASMSAFPEITSQLQKTAGATERIREILNEETESEAHSGSETTASSLTLGNISARKLNFAYPSRPDSPVLKGVDFDIKQGSKVALVGASGGGKSTVFSLLLGFYQQDKGDLLFGGKSVNDLGIGSVRQAISVVPQEVLLFGGSIMENIKYGKCGASDGDVIEAAKKANAHDFIEGFEEGYATSVGPRGVKLSGGQRQRIAIARAILADPEILLLDEATSALDSESEQLVQEALSSLMKGRTSIIIAHRLSTVRDADEILVLADGQVVEQGTHNYLLDLGGTYSLLAQTQFG